MIKTVLVVGGAGYIGSHMAKFLSQKDIHVVILDNLSTGYASLAKYGELIVGDFGDAALLDELFEEFHIDAVMHFGAASLVGESVTNPSKYFENNVSKTLVLLNSMINAGCLNFIFSSTAAVFGNPKYLPLDEQHQKVPINPYGRSKLMVEGVLEDYASAYGLSSVALRYFNAAGADPDCELGESHDPETHLIPLILKAALGVRESISIFGTDYDTPDGTCIRDYIHIKDLCSAHWAALNFLNSQTNNGAYSFNLGNGVGFSVREIIELAKIIVLEDGFDIHVEECPRREGDPDRLIANSNSARSELGWEPELGDLEIIIRHAWEWEKSKLNTTDFIKKD
jgi:UDP-glucose 4-epimerase